MWGSQGDQSHPSMMDVKSSQESLPLSQESYMTLFRELDGISFDSLMNNALNIPLADGEGNCFLIEERKNEDIKIEDDRYTSSTVPDIPLMTVEKMTEDKKTEDEGNLNSSRYNSIVASIPLMEQDVHENMYDYNRPVSSLPASESWPGEFAFKVSFPEQQHHKGMSWIYSEKRNKLYVGKDVPCPVNFSTDTRMPDNFIIRATPLFSSTDHASENVKRCVNHSMEELSQNIFEAEFFIRIESRNSVYEINPVTGRHSVVIPYENPAVGSTCSTYLLKFMCFGSCSGGPNRRPLMIIFTLERGQHVFGRQRVDLKVCACPARDFKLEEKQCMIKENKPPANNSSKKHQIDDSKILDVLPKMKKIKVDVDHYQHPTYNIQTRDKECYLFLKKMKRLFDLHKVFSTNPSLKTIINLSSQNSCSSGEEKDE